MKLMAKRNSQAPPPEGFEQFEALARKYEPTIKKISSFYCLGSGYNYHCMVYDLTTLLWDKYSSIPSGDNLLSEEDWVFTVLVRAALNILRAEQRHLSHIVFLSELPDLPDLPDSEPDPAIKELYGLISQLDDSDQELVLMYLDGKKYREMAAARQVSIQHIERQLSRIRSQMRD